MEHSKPVPLARMDHEVYAAFVRDLQDFIAARLSDNLSAAECAFALAEATGLILVPFGIDQHDKAIADLNAHTRKAIAAGTMFLAQYKKPS